jgi:hypothetical protein
MGMMLLSNKSSKIIAVLLIIVVVVSILLCYNYLLRKDETPIMNAKFMILDGEGPNAGGDFSKELGTNTIPIYLDQWSQFEPHENQWNWENAFPTNRDDYGHCLLRIGILHVLAWNPSNIPTWVNKSDLYGEFKEAYGEFVQEAVKQVEQRHISVDLYLVELEANYAGHEIKENTNITNAGIIDWIKWEVNLIKSIDPHAKIVIPLTPTEFRPEESLNNTNDQGKILVADFVERMIQADVQFDAFGFNVASGVYDKVDDWTALQTVLDNWSTIDKEIFVWAMGYPADNNDTLPFRNPRAGGYSEEWQKEQYVNSLKLLLENTKVIGISIDLYDYQESGWLTPVHWGLVGGDRTKPETLFKRPSFDVVKEYWHSNNR